MNAVRQRVSHRLAAVPLRTTLTLALVLVAALGLLISGVAVTSAMRGVLVERLDRQLDEAVHTWARPGAPRPDTPPPVRPDRNSPPQLFYVRVYDPLGNLLLHGDSGSYEPDVPADMGRGPITVGSVGDAAVTWRVLRWSGPSGTSTVAVPLEQTESFIDRLIVLQAVIGVLVLAVLAVVARLVIRRSLRPLRGVEETAAAIADGDLHRRVPVRGTDTEVDHLSRSLNGMLTQIQQAFAATEASEEAARRSEAKMRRFVADASHELRTPLTTIQGFSELYRQGAVTDPAVFMDRIEHESKRMGLLVEDLLMLARLDAQRPVERRPVDLLTLASDAVHAARTVDAARRPDGPARPIELEIADGTGTVEVSGDEARLRQVFTNLVHNALVHTPPEAAVTVRLTPAADAVLLEVADAGPGLEPEQAERVFERFYRADASRSRESGGSGLGLSIVQALVAAHGGTVAVTSTPGVGTTFTVRLPRTYSGTLAP
ncbi:HAMP domain-containing histidine kinase [Nocardia otitidiscaviarum]|uniref:sensor histidine kinase n=1 Tax=Nocardia otitidiscaviarum TaxID=1823 RepID=UPI0006944A20|nr:HAMP domain-containing sensor histidine kinase [Nocardia otitidiscaviarum]MBF6134114.1 HAMP domain-containing histidine kinase [Nocardia otitidiscaviarum]MBF6484224.1 HAMP domain-containing histidine kinase [Nocardia otitidiscaviarum]